MSSEPIPMRLPCPTCGALHVDSGVFATKPHHTHACQACGMVWRPALVTTVGVRFLPGYKDPETEVEARAVYEPVRDIPPGTVKARVLSTIEALGRDTSAEELVSVLDPPVEIATLRTTLWKLAEIDRVIGRGTHGVYRPMQRTPQDRTERSAKGESK